MLHIRTIMKRARALKEGVKLMLKPPHDHTKGNLPRKVKAHWMKEITRVKRTVISYLCLSPLRRARK